MGHSNFWDCDSKDFYVSALEAIPLNAPLLRGKEVDLHIFIESDHICNKQTMDYMNMSFIIWYSMKQSTIKTLVFGTVCVAMKVGVKILHVIQC